MKASRIIFAGMGAICVSGWMSAVIAATPGDEEFFEKEVRPLVAAKCLECHGSDSPEGDFRLTSREAVLKGGKSGVAVVVGKPDESPLMKAVLHQGKLKMPPDGRLRDVEIATIRRWIEMGMPWPEAKGGARRAFEITESDRDHWAFRRVSSPNIPAPIAGFSSTNAIDRFVAAKLSEASIKSAPPADRRTLLRRATYDLHGLPPTWEEVEKFANDPRPTEVVFAEVVEQLLKSPRYGERWGRHWLDVARFADTKDGVLMFGDDRLRPFAYTYRDYVIRAFNEDLPYDQFIQEQLAADLIQPPVEPWRLAAMGFLTLGRMYDNNVHDVIDDQIDTVGRGFLALTISCTRCHDHKSDPISTADYYGLYGIFASCETPIELPLVDKPENTPGGVEFENEVGPKRAELKQFLDEQFTLLSDTARIRVPDYLVHVATTPPDPLETAIFFLSLSPDDLRPPIVARWRYYLEQHAKESDPVFGLWRDLMSIDAMSADASGKPSVSFEEQAKEVVARWKAKAAGCVEGEVNPLVLAALESTRLTGKADVAKAYGELLKSVYEDAKKSGNPLRVTDPNDRCRQQLLDVLTSTDSPTYFPKNQTRKFMSREQTDKFGSKLTELDRMAAKSPNTPPRAMVVVDATVPHEPRIFTRGNPTQPGKRVPRQFLEVLSDGERQPFQNGSGRLELAKAIGNANNPLTARVIVNRIWMHHFGEPLVSSPSDFGKRCERPRHAELLDHLAAYFVEHGWSIKSLHRYIMSSAVYQQSVVAESIAADPENQLLSSARRRRLDFESMRDTLLTVSGQIEHRVSGRPIDIVANPLSHCRTVYALVDRQSLPSVYRAFDFATPDQSVERRPRTMVAQQALFALNSSFVIDQAKALIARPEVAKEADPNAKVEALFRIVFARKPDSNEVQALSEFVQQPKESDTQLSPWEQVAQVLLCSNELMYLD